MSWRAREGSDIQSIWSFHSRGYTNILGTTGYLYYIRNMTPNLPNSELLTYLSVLGTKNHVFSNWSGLSWSTQRIKFSCSDRFIRGRLSRPPSSASSTKSKKAKHCPWALQLASRSRKRAPERTPLDPGSTWMTCKSVFGGRLVMFGEPNARFLST